MVLWRTVRLFPFILVVSSLWQFPGWWEFADKPGGYPGSCAGCAAQHFHLHSSREEQILTTPWIVYLSNISVMFWPCTRQLGHTEQCEGVPWRPDTYSGCLWGSLNWWLLIWNNRKSMKRNNVSFNTTYQCLEQNYVNCKPQLEIQMIKLSKIYIQTIFSEVCAPVLVFSISSNDTRSGS